MKSLKEMEEAVDELTAYLCAGVLIVFLLCIIFYGIQIIIGLLVEISMGG